MTIARSIGSQWISSVYVAGISILLTLLLGRVLGAEVFGEYSYYLALGSIFAILQDGGFRTLIFRELTHPTFPDLRDKLVSIANGHNLLLTGGAILILAVLPLENKLLLILVVLSFGLSTGINFYSFQLRGEGQFVRDGKWRIWVRSATAISIVALIFLISPTIEWILLGAIGGNLLVMGFCYKRFRKYEFKRLERNVYQSMGALLIIDIATLVYFKIDIIMLQQMGREASEVGHYAASTRILEGGIFLFMPFAIVLFRELRLLIDNPPRLFSKTLKLAGLAFVTASLVGILPWIYGKEILVLTFGAQFQAGAYLLKSLTFALVIMIVNIVVTQVVLAIDGQGFYAWIAVVAALLNITINFFLIPSLGALGAVYGTIATELFLLITLFAGIFRWKILRGKAIRASS